MEDIVIVGRHAVKEAIVSGHTINKVRIQEGIGKQQINDTLKNIKAQKLITQTVSKSKLGNLANAPHQSVAAFIAPYGYADFDQLIQSQKEKEGLSTIITLDGLEDLHNLGSVVRTADAGGVDGVAIPRRCSVALTRIIARVSAGAIRHILATCVINLSEIVNELKDNGYRIADAEADNAIDYRNMVADIPLATVVGSERQNMNRLIKDKCDSYTRIPTVSHVSNLNASVTASLMIYEVYHKQHQIGDAQ